MVGAAPQAGTILYETDFESATDRAAWSKGDFAEWVELPGRGTCLRVTTPEGKTDGSYMIEMPLDLSEARGSQIVLECLARAENVSKPPKPWFGAKYMLHFKSESEGPFWRNPSAVYGTFDWKPLTFTANIPEDATGGRLSLGLQLSSGRAWFDDVKIRVLAAKPERPEPVADAPPPDRGHDLPRLRGVMSPNEYREGDLRDLAEDWNANVIRWQLTTAWGAKYQYPVDYDLEKYDAWLAKEMADLDLALEACERYGIYLVIDLHSPPGGRLPNGDMVMFHEPGYHEKFVEVWQALATRYRDHPAVWGYDLVNEPSQETPSPEGIPNWYDAQVETARAIREIDPDTPIIMTTIFSSSAEGFKYLEPLDLPRIIYQAHMYWPHAFTHQGIDGGGERMHYPGEYRGQRLNKEALREHLAPIREFQLAYNVPIYLGEFSAVRWAPDGSAARYISDCIELFEEYGWDWSYHAYREWHGWDLDLGPNKQDETPTTEPGPRKQLLLEWFAKNQRPEFE